LIAVARARPVSDAVPYAFEKRILAQLKAQTVDEWSLWARALWRAAAPCIAIMLVLAGWSLFTPTNTARASTFHSNLKIPSWPRRTRNNLPIRPGEHLEGHSGDDVDLWHRRSHRGFGRAPFGTSPRPSAPTQSQPGTASGNCFSRRLTARIPASRQRDLDLSAEQRERIDKLLKESQERTRKIMEPVAPEMRAELLRTKEEFQQVLTPGQRTHFEELMKKQQRPHEPHHTGGPRGQRVVETNY